MGVRPDDDVPPADIRTETLRRVVHDVDAEAGGGDRPASQLPGRASRVPGQPGVSPEPMETSTETGSVEMLRGLVPIGGDAIGELPEHPLDDTPPMPGTSEQAAPVRGVRTPRP